MIRPLRVCLLAGALVLGVGGFLLSALILTAGSVLLHLYDLEETDATDL